jgi:4-amino-4-deoxy-L-arabinose transferase-like glycosyltransferase
MVGIKNTKPPLLFWQGMVTTNWAQDWGLSQLRWPNLIYTGLTALLLLLVVKRMSGELKTGLLAAVVWLAFFNTYRYGRPFLADPAEIFWLMLPFFSLLYFGKRAFDSKWLFPLLTAIALGIALLYKSFAYILPVCFSLSIWFLRWREGYIFQVIKRDLLKLCVIGLISLGIFSLWFVLDPHPTEIWHEFVVGENAGKFKARTSYYLVDLLWGGDSIWNLALSTVANAGFLTLVVISAIHQSWKSRKYASTEIQLGWLLILCFFIVFCLPSQRSGRYLLPIMPILAAFVAIYWDQLSRWTFKIALVLQLITVSLLAWLGWNLQGQIPGTDLTWTFSTLHWPLISMTLLIVLAGLFVQSATKSAALIACFLSYMSLTSSLAPLENPLGRFNSQTIAAVQGKTIGVPCDFRAKDEEYRLLIPGASFKGYETIDAKDIEKLSNNFNLFAAQTPLGQAPILCEHCQVIGQRMEMRARHNNDEIKAMLKGEIKENLLVSEYLILSPNTDENAPSNLKDICR